MSNADPGFRLELAADVATLAESLRAGGYATYAVGSARRGIFRYTGDLRAVTYRPGARTVPADLVRAVTAEAESRAD